jgi:hypothetical protein
MPTLIRLFLVLAVLAGLGFAGMIALTVMVDPGTKDVTIKIPPGELMARDATDMIDVNDLPAPVNVAPREPSTEELSAETSVEDTGSEVKTVDVPAAE